MNKKVALVLSCGGARGIAHIGVIEGLLEQGYEISAIAGSSMGAVIGGVYAAGKLTEFKKWICELDKLEVFKLVDFTFSTQGFIRGERVFNEMKKFIGDHQIEGLRIPFVAIASDVVNKKEVVFDQGPLFKALRASAAIPSVLKPSIINGVELVDGGVVNPIPIDRVHREKGDLLVVSDVNAPIPYEYPKTLPPATPEKEGQYKAMLDQFIKKWNSLIPKKSENNNDVKRLSYFELVTSSVNLMQDKLSFYAVQTHQPDLNVQISRDACTTFEFYKAKEMIEAGKQAFNQELKNEHSGVK